MISQYNGGVEFSVEQIQNAYRLAYFIHPQEDLAISVLVEGMERAKLIARTISKRPVSNQPHKLPILNQDLLHVGVLTASELFELYQEFTGTPNQKKLAGYSSKYQPTRDDFVIRYIKKIYFLSSDRLARYFAIGIGTLVYRYKTVDILALSPDYFDNNNSSKIKKFYEEGLKSRFPMIDLHRNLVPDERTFKLAECCFNIFMLPSVRNSDFSQVVDVRDEYFAYDSTRSEREKFDALMGFGLERLICEYNAYLPYGSCELEDPAKILILPNSLNPNFNQAETDFEFRLNKTQLTENELHMMSMFSRKRDGIPGIDLLKKDETERDDEFLRYADDL
jgi:hypothetical protein